MATAGKKNLWMYKKLQKMVNSRVLVFVTNDAILQHALVLTQIGLVLVRQEWGHSRHMSCFDKINVTTPNNVAQFIWIPFQLLTMGESA